MYAERLEGGIEVVYLNQPCKKNALSGEMMTKLDALLRAADFCDSCIHETAKRQPGHWYGLAFEPVLKGTRV